MISVAQFAKLTAATCVVLVSLFVMPIACSRDGSADRADASPPQPAAESIVFPPALRAADDSVNQMILAAMNACLTGDYDAFRLLWSAKIEPMARDRFVNHFQAVKKISIRALEKDPSNEREAYALYAEVMFDAAQLPEHHELRANPVRRVILLLIREQNEWRLAGAPKAVRAWLAKKVEGEGAAEKTELFEEPAAPQKG